MRHFEFEGYEAPSAEHAFQYAKPKRESVRDWMMAAPSPFLLTVLSAALPTWEINKGWSKDVHSRMHAITRFKFQQHSDLAKILDDTGAEKLVYRPQDDSIPNRYWGEISGEGENALGEILMAVRRERRGER